MNREPVAAEGAAPKAGWRDAIAVYLRARVLIVTLLGFSAGLPLALSGSTLIVWMREAGVDLGAIGLLSLVGVPYSIKFLWAPLVDALDVPVLSRRLGRRRGWLVFAQLLLFAAIVALGLTDPARAPLIVAGGALLVAAASATQDIVIDAFRVESLEPREQAAGMAGYVAAYRLGTLVSTAGALFLVTFFAEEGLPTAAAWTAGYFAMAALVGVGIITTLIATEPAAPSGAAHEAGEAALSRVSQAAFGAFREFLSRRGAVLVLVFVVLYKLCDAFAGTMTAPFVLDLGFTRNDYAAIVKGVGLAATLIGGFFGASVARVLPLSMSLWIGGLLQMASNFAFVWLAGVGAKGWALAVAISVENFTGAIGTVIFVAYLSALCLDARHTATQYAVLTAFAAVGRIYVPAAAGFVAEAVGWSAFFTLSAAIALPGLVLLAVLQAHGHFAELEGARA